MGAPAVLGVQLLRMCVVTGHSRRWRGFELPVLAGAQMLRLLLCCVVLGSPQESQAPSGEVEFKATVDGQELYMTAADLAIKQHDSWKAIAEGYAANEAKFLKDFSAAWTKVMDADRFQGPAGSECSQPGAQLGADALGLLSGEPAVAVS